MAENIAGGAMTAFNRVGVDYSGASRNLLEQITRNEWGYTGAYVTDMINGADYMNWRDIVFMAAVLHLLLQHMQILKSA